LLVIKTISELF